MNLPPIKIDLPDVYKSYNRLKKGLILDPYEKRAILKLYTRLQSLRTRFSDFLRFARVRPHRSIFAFRINDIRVISHFDRKTTATTVEYTLDLLVPRARFIADQLRAVIDDLRDLLASILNYYKNLAHERARNRLAKKYYNRPFRQLPELYQKDILSLKYELSETQEEIWNEIYARNEFLRDVIRLYNYITNNDFSSPASARDLYARLREFLSRHRYTKIAPLLKSLANRLYLLVYTRRPTIVSIADRLENLEFDVELVGDNMLITRPRPVTLLRNYRANYPYPYIALYHALLFGAGVTAIKLYVKDPRKNTKRHKKHRGELVKVDHVSFHGLTSTREPFYVSDENVMHLRLEVFVTQKIARDERAITIIYMLLSMLIGAILTSARVFRDLSMLPHGRAIFRAILAKLSLTALYARIRDFVTDFVEGFLRRYYFIKIDTIYDPPPPPSAFIVLDTWRQYLAVTLALTLRSIYNTITIVSPARRSY